MAACEEYCVKPGAKVRLKDFDPADQGKYKSREQAQPETEANLRKLDELQSLLYAERRRSLLVVLQGLDGAGKDGTIRHIFSGVNPAGCDVMAFKEPTPIELSHDFLWRVHPHAPAKGMIEIFNRSHYEDVLVTRVHKLVSEKECGERYERINAFERLLAVENETVVLKFFLQISKEEQLERFRARLEDPSRQWKISDSDYREREYWDEYQKAYEDALSSTSTEWAPWYVIPSNHKWYRNLVISQIITDRMEKMKLKFPKPTADLAEIRRRYHREAGGAPSRKG